MTLSPRPSGLPPGSAPVWVAPLSLAIVCALSGPAPALAQPVLTGIVVSSEEGTPVPSATVTVETWDGQFVTEATTDTDGRFRITFEEARALVVSAAGPGYARSELQRVDLDPDEPTEIRLEVTPRSVPEPRPRLPEVEAAVGEIAGRVIDASSGRPVPGATVALLARRDDERIATVTTGPGGEFRIRVPETTTYRLQADLGDFGRSETLIVEGSTQRGLSFTIELISDPVQLEAITAEGRREIFWWQQEKPVFVWPYYERRHFYQRLNIGRFYDGQYLQDWGALSAYEFMKTHTFPTAMPRPETRRAESCAQVLVFLDGVSLGAYFLGLEGATGTDRSRIESNQMIIERIGHLSVQDLEGIEVYREGAFTPADLATDACQVISIWTGR